MSDLSVVYLSEDEATVQRLVETLRARWTTWWAKDISNGDWEAAVRTEIGNSKALIPVLSPSATGERRAILRDEIAFAQSKRKLIFPLLIGDAEVPFGLGSLNHTKAFGWKGDPAHPGLLELIEKIASQVPPTINMVASQTRRPRSISVGKKQLSLPAFAFSLSSHETQVRPKDGLQLMELLQPNACLLSAYDHWKHYRRDNVFSRRVEAVARSKSVLYLDSGNYEAYRKDDRFSKNNPTGWRREHFVNAARRLPADIVFSFDNVNIDGKPEGVGARIAAQYRRDQDDLGVKPFLLCPIVHCPKSTREIKPSDAPAIIADVVHRVSPPMVAIPERELGDGLITRVRTVRAIRKELDKFSTYYPLHLLGTGNPLSMIAFAAAGADSFDGLEWCRTMADYENGFLFHFQHYDLFGPARLTRVKDPRARAILADVGAPYSVKASCFNIDAFNDWAKTMRDMIHGGNEEHLLKMVPNIGAELYDEIAR